MENSKQFLQDTFTEIIEQINIKLDETKTIEGLFNKYKDILKKLDEIFVKEKETNRQNLEPDDFDFLRGIVFMKGSHEFHEKINGIMGYYILNYRTQPEFRKYTDFELIESDIKNIIQTEVDLLYKQIEDKNILNEYKDLLEKLVSAVNGNKYISVETTKLFEIIGNFKEVNNEYKTNILMSLIDYNNDVVKNSEINLEKQEEKVESEVLIEPVQNEVVEEQNTEENIELVISDEKEEKKKVKSVRNIKKKADSKKKKDIQEEKEIVADNIEEKIGLEEEKEVLDVVEITLSNQAQAIYDTIDSMIDTMDINDVISYLNDTSLWGKVYLEEIYNYCSLRKNIDKDRLLVEHLTKVLNKEKIINDSKKECILIFKGYENNGISFVRNVTNIKDKRALKELLEMFEELKQGIVKPQDRCANYGDLKGMFCKRSVYGTRLSYDIIKEGVYYVFDCELKTSNNEKYDKVRRNSAKLNEHEKDNLNNILSDGAKSKEIISINEEIYDNIISYIEEEVPELKNTGVSR